MARRVFLHVGSPKSGTTYLQSRLQRNAATLAEHGVLVPLGERGDRPGALVFRAALDLTGKRLNHPRSFTDGYWERLVDQVTSYDGATVVASHEAFVRADDAAVARAARELAAGGAELHVVYTARDLARALVSGWIEGLKNGTTHDLDEHLARARTGDLPLRSAFDVPEQLGRWLGHLPPERVHLVTLPPPGGDRTLLWERFLSVCGLQAEWLPLDARRVNDSVGVPEAQLLLALNRELDGANGRGGPLQGLVRRHLVGGALVGRRSPRVLLPPPHHGWVVEDAAANRAWVEASAVHVAGDLAELEPVATDPATWVDPAVPHPDVVGAAAAGLASVLTEAHRRGS